MASRAPSLPLPDVKCAQRFALRKVLLNEFPEEALVGTHRGVTVNVSPILRVPQLERAPCLRWKHASSARQMRAPRAEHAPGSGGERGALVTRHLSIACRTACESRSEAERRHDAPRAGYRPLICLCVRGRGKFVKGADNGVIHFGMGLVSTESQHEFSDRLGARKPAEPRGERRPRRLDVERSQRVQLAAAVGREVRRPLNEEIEGCTEATLRPSSPPGKHRLHAYLPRGEAEDTRALQIIESVQHDRFGDHRGHCWKLIRLCGEHSLSSLHGYAAGRV